MLTTTIAGLWVLQALTGVEAIAPELGLRPILPSVEKPHDALAHPIAEELRAAGAIDESGVVDPVIVEWLTVLSRRDVAVVMHVLRPEGQAPARVVIARFVQWWVTLERSDDLVRLSAAGSAAAEGSAHLLLTGEVERLCGAMPAARFRPVSLDLRRFREAVTDRGSLTAFLAEQHLDPDQIQMISAATDSENAAQASLVAVQAGVETGRPTRTYVGPGAVTVLDTVHGRLLVEQVASGDTQWLLISPGGKDNIGTAVNRLLRELPAEGDWHSYRKVV